MMTKITILSITILFTTLLSCSESENTAGNASVDLPEAAKKYFDGVNSNDIEATLALFSENSTVVDVGRNIAGKDNIRNWLRNEVMGGRYEILEVTDKGDETRVLVRFSPRGSGGFRANYDFTISNSLITRMNLTYA